MSTYFSDLPLELVNIITSYLNTQDESEFTKLYSDSVNYNKYNSPENWEYTYSLIIPEYSNIKNIMSLDYKLRTHRFRNWKVLYFDSKLLLKHFSNLIDVNLAFLDNKDVNILGVSIETIEIIYSLRLYRDFPVFYNKINQAPDCIVINRELYQELEHYRAYPDDFQKFMKAVNSNKININFSLLPVILVILIQNLFESYSNKKYFIDYILHECLSNTIIINETNIDYSRKSLQLTCIKKVLNYFDNDILVEYGAKNKYLTEVIVSVRPELADLLSDMRENRMLVFTY